MDRSRSRLAAILVVLFLFSGAAGSASAQTGQEATLLVPSEINAGGKSAATVTAFDAATRAGADLEVTLYLVEGELRTQSLGSARTGGSGHVTIPFDVPRKAAGAYAIEAAIGGGIQPLWAAVVLSDAPAILLETDKPIYKPSQTIQGRVLLLDNGLRPQPGQVEVSINDAKGIRIDRKKLTANDYGVAPFELVLGSEVNFGVWKIHAAAGGQESSLDVRVEDYVLPRYELSAELERTWVLPDEPIQGTVKARYFFGRPVEGRAEVVARRYVGSWEPFGQTEGTFSDGALRFQLPAVGFAAGTAQDGGLATVTLDITATDSTGFTQTTKEVLTVSPAPVVVGLIAASRTLKPGMATEVLVTTKAPDGAPRDASAAITTAFFDTDGTQISSQTTTVATTGGVATLSVTPPEKASRATFDAAVTVDGKRATASIEVNAAYSPSESFLSIVRSGTDAPAQVGEELAFKATSTNPGTVFYDVYAGGRTVFSGASDTSEVRFRATPDMAPSARIVAYLINPNNEIAADTAPFQVVLPSALTLETGLDREDLKPGDVLTLTIDAGRRAMVGLSIVDLSVLALGKSRLHLGDVFAELERRFMEPQAETHDDGGGVGPAGGLPGGPVGGPFWLGRSRSPGVAEVLKQAGLTLVATPGVVVPQGRFNFRLEDVDILAGAPPAGPGKSSSTTTPPDPVRVRQFFPETWVWNPVLLTDDSGRATLNLTVPDSITGWQLSAMASSAEGLGFGERKITVFQDFFVEPDLPAAVTRGEEFPIKVQIYNYLPSAQTVTLSFGPGDWYDLLGAADLTVEVPAGSATSAHFPIRPTLVGDQRVVVTARGSVLSDAVVREIRVEAEGQPVEEVLNSLIRAGDTLPLDTSLPAFSIADSGRAFLSITPSPVAQTLSGVSDLLGMPYGCGEQNMIFTAPDLEVLRYLKANGELIPEVRAQAEYFLNVGYQRELTFQTDDGGFAAFGGKEGTLWLTAFVLSTFSAAREVRDIDEAVLSRAAGMLMSRQNADGSFRTDDFLIHKELDGGQTNGYSMTAYVANALADYVSPSGDGAADTVKGSLAKAAGYLRDARSAVDGDSYSLAIAALALGKVAGFEPAAAQVLDRLLELAKVDGFGIHWEPYPIETTGYAAMALLAEDRPQAAAAIEWLSTQRNSLGGYGHSTQDTVVAIRALIAAAMKVRSDLEATLTVLDGESVLARFQVDGSNYDLLQTAELPAGRATGLALRSEGRGNVGFQVARKYHVPGDRLPPPRDMAIEVVYDAQGIEVDDIVEVIVRVKYTGPKKETGMTLVDVGVPTGFEPVRASLDALVSSKAASRVEVAGRKVILYLDGLVHDTGLELRFQVKALYPVRAEPPISRIYEYYDPEVQAVTRGPGLVVTSPAPRNFVRGDLNGDGTVDLSDAVGILGYLFLGETVPTCLDAGDVNDDGSIEITDSILLLNHLFLGGPPPLAPFPAAGPDPTEDSLDC
jgi:CD109 antigen